MSQQTIKEKVYSILNFAESKKPLAYLVTLGIILICIATGLIALLGTVASFRPHLLLINIIGIIFSSIFLLEFILRFWSSDANGKDNTNKSKRLIYLKSIIGIIDLTCAISFVPSLIVLFNTELIDLIVLIRLVAILKLVRYITPFEIIWTVVRRKKEELIITLMLSLILLFFGSLFIYIAEHDAQPDVITNLFDSMWFTSVNFFTIGYGDVIPITPFGKIISAIISFMGITLFLLPASVIGSGFIDEVQERNPQYHVCPNCDEKFERNKALNEKRILEAGKAKENVKQHPVNNIKHKCYKLIEFRFPRGLSQIVVLFFFATMITFNVLAIMAETNPILSLEIRPVLNIILVLSIVVFTSEFILRLWSCSASEQEEYQNSINGRLKHLSRPLAIADSIFLVSLYVSLVLTLLSIEFQYVLILRLFIVFKIGHFIDVFSVIGDIFRYTKKEFAGAILICIIFLIFATTAIYFVERDAQPEKFTFPNALWFGIITFTTTGFGDFYPVTTLGRFLTICFAFLGVSLFTLPAGILGSSFYSSMQEYRTYKICPKCKFVLSKPKFNNKG